MTNNNDHILRFRRTVPSRTEELHPIRKIVEREALRFGFDDNTAHRMMLAVDEACANVIKHAYREAPEKKFSIEIYTEANKFIVVLTDRGKEFQPSSIPSVNMHAYLKEMKRGGLGLHIMNLVMDQIDYGLTSDQANRLQMIKYLHSNGDRASL